MPCTFLRGTNNIHEPYLVASGKIKPSYNHLTGEEEFGLSVCDKHEDVIHLLKYFILVYKVSGVPLSKLGPDGETLLDIGTIRLAY